MRKGLVAALAVAFVLGMGTAVLVPAGGLAAEKRTKEASACDRITDKKKKAECAKAEATEKYKNEAMACDKIKDKKKKAKCMKAADAGNKKAKK